MPLKIIQGISNPQTQEKARGNKVGPTKPNENNEDILPLVSENNCNLGKETHKNAPIKKLDSIDQDFDNMPLINHLTSPNSRRGVPNLEVMIEHILNLFIMH